MTTLLTFLKIIQFLLVFQLMNMVRDGYKITILHNDIIENNTTLYTHNDCPFSKQSCTDVFIQKLDNGCDIRLPAPHCCAPEHLKEENSWRAMFVNEIVKRRAIHNSQQNQEKIKVIIPSDIKQHCPLCVNKITMPTKFLKRIQQHMSDPRCNHTLPQHDHRYKNNNQFQLRKR